nr:acyl-CoA dehydratase activase-related protein [Cellulosilyticum ruminicola]
MPNLVAYKYEAIRNYVPEVINPNLRGKIGMPMVLNMYENSTFWATLFAKLGFEVVLSDESSKALYEIGLESIASETACYPAKMFYGYIESLLKKELNTFSIHVLYMKKIKLVKMLTTLTVLL